MFAHACNRRFCASKRQELQDCIGD